MRAPTASRRRCTLIKEGKPIRYVGVIGPVQLRPERRHHRARSACGGSRTARSRPTGEMSDRGRSTPSRRRWAGCRPMAWRRPTASARARAGDQPARHRPVAGGRHGARRPPLDPDRRPPAHGRLCRPRASTASTWPTTTAAPSSSPAACCARPRLAGAGHLHQMVPDARADDAATSCARASAAAWSGCGVERIDLLQLHWWTFEHPGYLDAMRRAGGAAAARADRPSGRHQFRHRPSAAAGEARLPDRLQPGLLLAARPPRRRGDERLLPRPTASAAGLWHARRRLPAERWLGRRSRPHRRLEQDEVQALHRRHRRLGRAADDPRRPRRGRAPARRLGRQRRDALGAGAAGGRRR